MEMWLKSLNKGGGGGGGGGVLMGEVEANWGGVGRWGWGGGVMVGGLFIQ